MLTGCAECHIENILVLDETTDYFYPRIFKAERYTAWILSLGYRHLRTGAIQNKNPY